MLLRLLLAFLLLQGTTKVGPTTAVGPTTHTPGAGTAPPPIKSCNGSNFGATTQTCVFGSNVASTSIIYIQAEIIATTTISLSGSGAGCSGMTITTNTNTPFHQSGSTAIEGWGRPSSGACTITVTGGASASQSISAVEYGPSTGGVDNMVDLQLQSTITSGSNISCPAITTASTNERVVCAMNDLDAGAGTYTGGSGFTPIDAQGTNYGWLFESQAKAAAGSITPVATYSATKSFATGSIAIDP